MGSVFEHDATPTWSGFIYQGHVAIYLAIDKICELLLNDLLDKEMIASVYHLEVENWEDIAIIKKDGKIKSYLSIHQVKNRKEKNIADYKSPLIQLMLERGLLNKQGLGNVNAYLHISNEIKESENEIEQLLLEWKENIINFNKNLKTFISDDREIGDEKEFRKKIYEEIESEPIGLNRAGYETKLKRIKGVVNDKCNINELIKYIKELIDYLNTELAIDNIEENVKLYQYKDKMLYCAIEKVFDKIVGQVKEYKKITNSHEKFTSEQYVYIADKLLAYMRKHILERHQLMQSNKGYQREIPFRDILKVLDDSISDYETKANMLALRRNYDEALAQYCRVICKNACGKNADYECKLLNSEYSKVDLDDEAFKKLCFGYNPNCNKRIEDRSCLTELLNRTGLQDSVFEVLKRVPGRHFIQEQNEARTVLKDKNRNAFLTAIVDSNSEIVVENIVEGINNNAELVSPIFEADELITVHLHLEDESIWDQNYSEIDEKYLSKNMLNNSDDNRNSICRPKKPIFVRANEVIERLT